MRIILRNLGYKVKQPAHVVFATALLWIKQKCLKRLCFLQLNLHKTQSNIGSFKNPMLKCLRMGFDFFFF